MDGRTTVEKQYEKIKEVAHFDYAENIAGSNVSIEYYTYEDSWIRVHFINLNKNKRIIKRIEHSYSA